MKPIRKQAHCAHQKTGACGACFAEERAKTEFAMATLWQVLCGGAFEEGRQQETIKHLLALLDRALPEEG